MNRQRVVLGLSGGIDSAMAAAILVERGFEVIGATLRLGHRLARAEKEIERARAVAQRLGIEHVVEDETQRFERAVIAPFVQGYLRGVTPSPCPGCNAQVKLPALAAVADRVGAPWIATGHYAKIRRGDGAVPRVERGTDRSKDQSYFLALVPPDLLERLLLPLGEHTKQQVRAMARERGWTQWADMPESSDLCFVPDADYARFVERWAGEIPSPGDIVDRNGRILGRHGGVHTVTIGQRKGLGVATGKRMFVRSIDPETRTVVVGTDEEVWFRQLRVNEPVVAEGETLNRKLAVQVRYRHRPAPAMVRLQDGAMVVSFDPPVRAASPGQVAVVYDGSTVVAGGVISSVQGTDE